MDIELGRDQAFNVYNRVRRSFPARDEIPDCNVEGQAMYLDGGNWCRNVAGDQRRIVIEAGKVTVQNVTHGRWVDEHAYAEPG